LRFLLIIVCIIKDAVSKFAIGNVHPIAPKNEQLLIINSVITMKKRLFLAILAAMFVAISSTADTTPTPQIILDGDFGGHSEGAHGITYIKYLYDELWVFDYRVSAIGEGDVHLYLNGEEVSNPYEISHAYLDYSQVYSDQVWQFTATAQIEGYEMSETTRDIVSPGIPSYSIFHDEASDSFWMELNSSYGGTIYYKTQFIDPYDDNWDWISTDWQKYEGPFKVWYAPQPLFEYNCVIEVYSSNDGNMDVVGSDMGTILSLKDEIDDFGIYGYEYYRDGFYFRPDYGICNKYCNPHAYPPCYSGDITTPSVSTIHNKTFAHCPDLTSIVLQNSISEIGSNAFSGCSGLRSITCKPVTPPSTSNSFADESIFTQATLFVPNESLEAYRAHEEWKRFSRIVPFVGAGPGDSNGDGDINIADVTSLIDQLLSGEEIPPYVDVNGDGEINISDVTMLIDMLLR